MQLPQDPFILLSMVNMKLRDEFSTLKDFCESNDIDEENLRSVLAAAGFDYMPEINQFR